MLCRPSGFCSVRDWTRVFHVIGFDNIGIHRPHVIDLVLNFFIVIIFTLESGFKNIHIHCRIHRMPVDGSFIRKEKVGDTKVSDYVWIGPRPLRWFDS